VTRGEFLAYYKKNKVVVLGVPAIIGVLLLDLVVLRPARKAKREGTTTTTAQPAATPTAAAPAGAGAEPSPLVPPPPITVPQLPNLDPRVESRFMATDRYPYVDSRNVFYKPRTKTASFAPVSAPASHEGDRVERPDLTYHGFFTLGPQKVAIVRLGDRLVLTQVGQRIRDSAFLVQEVWPDHVVITSTDDPGRSFEVTLSGRTDVAVAPSGGK
jgi:hypothetical protein